MENILIYTTWGWYCEDKHHYPPNRHPLVVAKAVGGIYDRD